MRYLLYIMLSKKCNILKVSVVFENKMSREKEYLSFLKSGYLINCLFIYKIWNVNPQADCNLFEVARSFFTAF